MSSFSDLRFSHLTVQADQVAEIDGLGFRVYDLSLLLETHNYRWMLGPLRLMIWIFKVAFRSSCPRSMQLPTAKWVVL